jgi:hypothetical protein
MNESIRRLRSEARQLAPMKAASSAKLGGSWMVVTVGVWLGT